MKFSLRFNNDRPVAEYIALAQAAEQAGFDQFWVSDDLFLRSAVVILAAVAIGLGVRPQLLLPLSLIQLVVARKNSS